MLQDITPNPAVNRFIVDILEGQVITLAVVVAFILVFLIREWVVQQQPIINLGAGRVEVDNAAQAPVEPVPAAAADGADDTETAQALVEDASPSGRLGEQGISVQRPVLDEEVNAAERQAGPEEQPSQKDSIDTLIDAMSATTARFRSDLDMQDSDSFASLSSDFTDHAESITTTLLKLQEQGSEAIDADDFEHLAALARQALRLHEGIRANIPEEINTSLLRSATEVLEWLQTAAALVAEYNGLANKARRSFSSPSAPNRSSVSIESSDANPDTSVRRMSAADLSTLLRPMMPLRSKSSVATEIQRSLEEARLAGFIPLESQAQMPDKDAESSQDSSDTWNVVPMLDSDSSSSDSDTSSQTEESEEESDNESQATQPALNNASSLDHAADSEVVPHGAPGLMERLLDWLFMDIGPLDPQAPINDHDDEHVVENVDDEPPFVAFANAEPALLNEVEAVEGVEEDRGDIANGQDVGLNANDQDIVDDIEDLEGIMELIGMQGPLMGLFQNSVFCAVLISATVTSAVWFPYLWGKIVLVFLANPLQLVIKAPWLVFTGLTNFAIDFALCIGGIALSWIDTMLRFALIPLGWLIPSIASSLAWTGFGKATAGVADAALARLFDTLLAVNEATSTDFYHLSLNSHAALQTIRNTVASAMDIAKTSFVIILHLANFVKSRNVSNRLLLRTVRWTYSHIIRSPHRLAATVAAAMDLVNSVKNHTPDTKHASGILAPGTTMLWSTSDRVIAITAGYAFFAAAGALYLKAGPPIASSQRGKKIEAFLSELLQQAGGVLKVILIISIEMLVFPLYCGLLLDAATLPLFDNASLQSRISPTLNSPWTSGFVHWFIGTCYMFHFALFVSMCRKIVRSGVLYFIRDPDDPTFHPVRDVLERSISSQLRKIGFSALVYGGLVILCMGSVVWAVAYGFHDIFPIRWSSDTPVLEFPIDLLLYNTVAPLVVHLLKPSKVLHSIYGWWFKKCARALRLSNFLFGEKAEDEERRQTLEDGSISTRGGRFVRAPGSDQVRIPKGRTVFVEVDEDNKRLYGEDDEQYEDEKDKYTKVFVPSWFRMRIAGFVFLVWALTAAAGLALTVAPVLLGRYTLGSLAQPGQQVNDVYTFFAGMCAFGVFSYIAASYRTVVDYIQTHVVAPGHNLTTTLRSVCHATRRALKLVYVYGFLTVALPALMALLLEFYLIMPLRTYTTIRRHLDGPATDALPPAEDHTIHFLQDWTLGLLYLRIVIRMINARYTTRPARALRAIVETGWLDPNSKLATRCCILPCTFLATAALITPVPLGWLATIILPYMDLSPEMQLDDVQVMRFAYPAVLFAAASVWSGFMTAKAVKRWRGRIRNEVYLIGERLHNFGESAPPPPPTSAGKGKGPAVEAAGA